MVAELGPLRTGRRQPAPAQPRAEVGEVARMAELEPGQRVPRDPRPVRGRARHRPAGASAPAARRARLSETLEPALPDHLDEQAERLMHRVCDAGLTIATAESCTGGMLAALLTDIEGAGHGFDRGFVVYTKQSKRSEERRVGKEGSTR